MCFLVFCQGNLGLKNEKNGGIFEMGLWKRSYKKGKKRRDPTIIEHKKVQTSNVMKLVFVQWFFTPIMIRSNPSMVNQILNHHIIV